MKRNCSYTGSVSSAGLVRAVSHDYKALVIHFETATNDQNRDSKEKAACKGLKMILTHTSFVDLLLAALTEIKDLSLQLQKRYASLIRAHKQV
jgi:hypothetical protein